MSDEPATATIASRIQERMEILNLNPYSTALKAGLGADYVRDILRGKVRKPSAEKLGKLAIALECSMIYLLTGKTIRVESQQELWDRAPIDDDLELSSSILVATTTVLEIRHELIADVYRDAASVTGRPLGSEPMSIPEAYLNHEQWLEVVRDNSMSRVAPAGSLVHVIEYDDSKRDELVHGDLVVMVKRITEAGAQIHVVERSLRRVCHRYPDLGLWFLEYYSDDEAINLTDDVFRQDDERVKARLARLQERQASLEVGPSVEALTGKSRKQLDELIAEDRRRRARIVGKVIRVITPVDEKARFTVASRII